MSGPWALAAESVPPAAAAPPRHFATAAAQFRQFTGADYLGGCDFRLNGVVTLVDTNRALIVVQDPTGAVALHFDLKGQPLQVGEAVTLEGTNGCPYFPGFPDYPFRPSGSEILPSFEAPKDWGEYHLTRMRGVVHPPATGEYTFWIASDNSSELWLGTGPDASRARKIAAIARFDWVLPREWSRFPSQKSDPVLLQAGQAYYLEALAEQNVLGENLAVAWQGPGRPRSILAAPYLTAYGTSGAGSNGVLREYWTNFSAGDLAGLTGPRAFEAALTVQQVRVSRARPGVLPSPSPMALDQRLRPEDNYRWVQVEGMVKFLSEEGEQACLELTDGRASVQVRVAHWSAALSPGLRSSPVRVEGVCEGVYDRTERLVPGLIWASARSSLSLVAAAGTNGTGLAAAPPAPAAAATQPAMQGFYATRCVVTFNDRVLDHDYIFVQENNAAMLVRLENPSLKEQLQVGRWVDLGGALAPGKGMPVLTPLIVKGLGWQPMPAPIDEPLGQPASGTREGRWTELEGVVHWAHPNGTLSLAGKDGPAWLWIGQTASNRLSRYVEATVRARGVLLLSRLDRPLLLVPSRSFVHVEEPPPAEPFGGPIRPIAGLLAEPRPSAGGHRVRIAGEVTYGDAQSLFVQDSSGGIRVRTAEPAPGKVGSAVEVLGFPVWNGPVGHLAAGLVRPAAAVEPVKPSPLNLSEALSSRQRGTLVQVHATFLAFLTNGAARVLELQERQRVFQASLEAGRGTFPDIAPGSRLRVTGVCDDESAPDPGAGERAGRAPLLASLNLLLRSPQDVTVLSGPPWWTWQRTAGLVGALLTVIAVGLLWIHLLRRRLERQQAAQLAFSRHVLDRLEDERRRIAVNLHDSLGQMLLVIKNHALVAIQRPPDAQGLRHRLDEISGATSQAIEEVRQITHGLRPYQLDRLGLTQAVRASVSQATANTSTSFATRVEDIDGLFDKDAEIHVYRIVQEAVTNVVKHAQASEATVVIKQRAGVVSLCVRDNGRGFDPAKLSSHPHEIGYGLSGISERVRILGGTLTIDSRPREGTSLTAEVPVAIRNHDTPNHSANRG